MLWLERPLVCAGGALRVSAAAVPSVRCFEGGAQKSHSSVVCLPFPNEQVKSAGWGLRTYSAAVEQIQTDILIVST